MEVFKTFLLYYFCYIKRSRSVCCGLKITSYGRICSRCTGPLQDYSRGCPQGYGQESSSLPRRSDRRTGKRYIRCTYLPCSSFWSPPFLVIGLVCTKPQKQYEKRVPNIDKQTLYEYNICGKRRFSKTSYYKTKISFLKKGKLL